MSRAARRRRPGGEGRRRSGRKTSVRGATGPAPAHPPSDTKLRIRRGILLSLWLLSGLAVLYRAAEIQLVQGSEWRLEADRQHRRLSEVPAARGAILDRDGVPLALSHETFRVGVAPHEILDREGTAERLADALGLGTPEASRIVEASGRWVVVPGRFPPQIRDGLEGLRGVYVERELRRFYPQEGLARGILGSVIDDLGAGGVEQQFEAHLRGVPGTEMLARDSEGRLIPGETWMTSPPRPGGSVVLTLDAELQEIVNEALREAIVATGASGGDVIVTDPRTGEVLAMVSVRDGMPAHMGGIHTPYEPGSTLKPFTLATLLRSGKAALSDSVQTGSGYWVTNGRQITDVSAVGTVTLARALQVSSNVGIARATQALTPEEQYEGLRDFGFGVPTGIALPGEIGGTLRRPASWSGQSSASLAIGYEIAVTPVQMAMAYGALANGGVLMEPMLIRELRDEQGRTIERLEPRPVRRVIPDTVARELTQTLVEAVEVGTGTQARLASFAVAGKSGTSRAYGDQGYAVGAYYASFVGYFPAEDPQLVVFVKLDRPRGTYYGGATAAPVTRATMEAILAARKSPLDREALAAIARAQRSTLDGPMPSPVTMSGAGSGALFLAGDRTAEAPLLNGLPVLRVDDSAPETQTLGPQVASGMVVVPDLRGFTPRAAARRLHRLGLAVVWESAVMVTGTTPAAGTTLVRGEAVRLLPGSSTGGPPAERRP